MGYTDIKELLKDARDIASGANDLQLKGLLLDIQGMVYDLQDENRELREENHMLKNNVINEDELIKTGSFWMKADKPYFYCPSCWGSSNKLVVCNEVKLGTFGKGGEPTSTTNERCPVCKFTARKPDKSN